MPNQSRSLAAVVIRLATAFVALVSFSAFLANAAAGLDRSTRPVGPIAAWSVGALAPYDASHLYFKFTEGSRISLRGGRFLDGSGAAVLDVEQALAAVMPGSIEPTFDVDRETALSWKAAGERASGQPGPDLSLWYDAAVTGGQAALARTLNALNACPEIEIAHPAPVVPLATLGGPATAAGSPAVSGAAPRAAGVGTGPGAIPQSPTTTPDFTNRQTYLGPVPTGLNASAAWVQPGGLGDGVHFIDVELNWTVNHEDFDYSRFFYQGGATPDPSYETHGTAVLGEILGQNNGYGVNGFSPHANYGVEAITVAEWPNVPGYFQDAVNHLSTGDIWQIELQMQGPNNVIPMEYLQVNYDVIWTSVWSRNIACLEAGANGSQNLDSPTYGGLFDRHVRDSGAIMVAAGAPTTLLPEYFTNYGTRMDAHAWGDGITTTGYGDLYNGGTLQTRYTAQFSGTSGATPMVCGSTICLQGIARAQLGGPLAPTTLRTIITNTGTPQGSDSRLIGPRPNLAAAVAAIQALDAVAPLPSAIGSALQVVPNPSSVAMTIRWLGVGTAPGILRITDAGGRLVRILSARAGLNSGQSLIWDGRDDAGRMVGQGVYFLHTEAGGDPQTVKLTRLR